MPGRFRALRLADGLPATLTAPCRGQTHDLRTCRPSFILANSHCLTKLRAMTCNKPQAASEIVAALEQSLPPDPRLCDLVNALGERAGGLLLVAMAIPAIIPAPGVPLGTAFGTILVIIACRMMASGTELGLPHWFACVRLRAPVIALLSRRGPALLRRVEGGLRPRVSLLVAEPITLPLALVVALMGLLIALPIPFGNTLPGFAVILMGLGLAVGDGLAVLGALILATFATVTSLVLGWAAVASIIHLLA
jgi:hypothetical protein